MIYLSFLPYVAIILIGASYNLYLVDRILKAKKRKFKVTGNCFKPIQKKMIQNFLDKNQDELEDKAKKDMMNFIATGGEF